jgi:hypothetical protein
MQKLYHEREKRLKNRERKSKRLGERQRQWWGDSSGRREENEWKREEQKEQGAKRKGGCWKKKWQNPLKVSINTLHPSRQQDQSPVNTTAARMSDSRLALASCSSAQFCASTHT